MMFDTDDRTSRAPLPMWIGGAVSVGIAVVALVMMWGLALPVTTPPGSVCLAIYPPPAGCAGDARVLPAAVWSALVTAAAAGAFGLGRRGWWAGAAGVAITAIVAVAGYLATWQMRVLLFV